MGETIPAHVMETARTLARNAVTVHEADGWLNDAALPIARAIMDAAPPAPPPATELVEALEKLVDCLEVSDMGRLQTGWTVPYNTSKAAFDHARSALAKFKEQSHG